MSRYLIRVNGHLSDELSASLRGLDAQYQPAQTILVGDLADQAALTGILERLDLLGVEIHEVLLVPDSPRARWTGGGLQAVPENGDTGRSGTEAVSPDSGETHGKRRGGDDSRAGG